jgi:hypothetical protein
MTFMKAAIVGKDDEQFLSDTLDDQTLKANAEEPAKQDAGNAATATPTNNAAARIVKTRTPVGTASSAPVTPSRVEPTTQFAMKPLRGPSRAKPQVKPAFSPRSVPAKPPAAANPARVQPGG